MSPDCHQVTEPHGIIPLGLEFLIAGDIIRNVVADPIVPNIVALGLIALLPTLLGMTLQWEVDGRWSWQRRG
jgi:uncharacterized membrane protein